MADVRITCTDQGPYQVQGPITLIGADGAEIPVDGDAWLCRCGGSASKPFCDGTHARIGGFAAAEAARDASGKPKA